MTARSQAVVLPFGARIRRQHRSLTMVSCMHVSRGRQRSASPHPHTWKPTQNSGGPGTLVAGRLHSASVVYVQQASVIRASPPFSIVVALTDACGSHTDNTVSLRQRAFPPAMVHESCYTAGIQPQALVAGRTIDPPSPTHHVIVCRQMGLVTALQRGTTPSASSRHPCIGKKVRQVPMQAR